MTLAVLVALASGSAAGHGQPSIEPGFASSDWHIREQVFTAKYAVTLATTGSAFRITLNPSDEKSLVALLLKEAAFPTSREAPSDLGDSEAYSDYFADVISVVSALGTPEAAEALLNRRVLVTGKMATDGVARAGKWIVGDVLAAYDDATRHQHGGTPPDDGYRLCLVAVMHDLLAEQIPEGDRASILRRLADGRP